MWKEKKTQVGISKLKAGEVYEEAKKQAEIMNKSFEKVLTMEIDLKKKWGVFKKMVLRDPEVEVQEMKNLLKKQNVNKVPGFDRVSNWILRVQGATCRWDDVDSEVTKIR